MLSPEGEEQEFDFYLKFAKPLVLNLPDTNDRIKAATWIKYLKNDTTSHPALRGNYLKLLLFVLQRRKLFGPFATIPDESKPLEEFPADINIQDVAKNFVEIDKNLIKITLERGGFGEWPPYTVACSSDLSEYVCCQEIPNFGIHAYYAISKEPLNVWNNYDKAIFPIGESIDSSNPKFSVVETVSPDISCFVSSNPAEPTSQSTQRASPRVPAGGFGSNTAELSDVSPSSLKGQNIQMVDDLQIDPRIPPNWGSNLVNVKDSPQIPPRKKTKQYDGDATEKDLLDFFNEDTEGEIISIQPSSSSVGPCGTPPQCSSTPRQPPPSPPAPQKHNNAGCNQCNAMNKSQKSSPKSSPNRKPLTTNKMFDALDYVADNNKDMSDYYEQCCENPANSEENRNQSANTSYKSETSMGTCCSKMEPSRGVAHAVQEILDEMHEPSLGFLQAAGNLIEKTILNNVMETPRQDIFHTPAPHTPRRADHGNMSSLGASTTQQCAASMREPVWASSAHFMKYKKGMAPTPLCSVETPKICNDVEGPMWASSTQYDKYRPRCNPAGKKTNKNVSHQSSDINVDYDSISQDLGSDFCVQRSKFPGPQYVVDGQSEVLEVVDYISKYIEDDLRVHNARIPATTPQRSQSPKRLHAGFEAPPRNNKMGRNCNVNPSVSSKNLFCFQAIMNVYERMCNLTL